MLNGVRYIFIFWRILIVVIKTVDTSLKKRNLLSENRVFSISDIFYSFTFLTDVFYYYNKTLNLLWNFVFTERNRTFNEYYRLLGLKNIRSIGMWNIGVYKSLFQLFCQSTFWVNASLFRHLWKSKSFVARLIGNE